MHNYLWHEIRNDWLNYTNDVRLKLSQAGWEPPRPALAANGYPMLTNDSGEDYLYMHHQMILYANKVLAGLGDPNYPRIEGWTALPPPGDPDWPVPQAWFDPLEFPIITQFIARSKTDIAFYKNFKSWERLFTDPGFLVAVTLGELGSLIHFTLHDGVKRRWSAVPGGRRPDPGPTDVESIPTEWDGLWYDYLADTYAMQVNPIYWQFYGWVDDRIQDWKLAHSVFGDDFWKGRWVGKMPEPAAQGLTSSLFQTLEDSQVAEQHAREAQRCLTLIAEAGVGPTSFGPRVEGIG
jgi:hypothetical protein